MKNPYESNFGIITVYFSGVRIFRSFMVYFQPVYKDNPWEKGILALFTGGLCSEGQFQELSTYIKSCQFKNKRISRHVVE